MVRKRQGLAARTLAARKSTARKRQASRRQRTAAGVSRSTDWECPRCSRWFAIRRNGPDNHLRSCLKQSSSSTQGIGPKSASPPNISKDLSKTEGYGSTGSSSDSGSSETSDTNSDTPPNGFAHKRGARRVRSKDFENDHGKI